MYIIGIHVKADSYQIYINEEASFRRPLLLRFYLVFPVQRTYLLNYDSLSNHFTCFTHIDA